MVWPNKIFPSPLFVLLLDPGSEIRDSGWIKIRSGLRDKHPGSATLTVCGYLEEPLVSEYKVERGPAHSEGETPLLQLNNQNNRNQTDIFPVIGI